VKKRGFLREEDGQASSEYVILAGGIIVVAVLIYVAYYGMVKSSGQSLNASAASATETMGNLIENASSSLS
jgi:uncharacterized protein (UPF0333 family)